MEDNWQVVHDCANVPYFWQRGSLQLPKDGLFKSYPKKKKGQRSLPQNIMTH